ncbi:MAG: indole-3-glycerol-phosphate synthase [Deinococcus sp.]|nr:indole-3-glycerol-phosphate synthase [Deinococcus sp.]
MTFTHLPGVLGEICRRRLADVAKLRSRPLPERHAGPVRSLRTTLAGPRVGVIAEIKRASPSQGRIADLDAAATAELYQRCGARGISVLTEPHWFQGSEADLRSARGQVALPVLRKDFLVDLYQVAEAWSWGADVVLLIVTVLGRRLPQFLEAARKRGLEALVEVHTASELRWALECGADLIGINNRDLHTLKVDTQVTLELVAHLDRPKGLVLVAESGYSQPQEIRQLEAAGIHGVLIGTSVAGDADPERTLRRLVRYWES